MNTENQPLIINELTPIGFRVLLKPYEKPETTSAGFFIPESENSGMPAMGQIVILGRKTIWEKLQLFLGLKQSYSVGDLVYFRKYSVDELRISAPDGETVIFILEEDEIIGLVNK